MRGVTTDSRAFFNRPELASRTSRFAPDQLTQATGESKLPSLAKEGWTRHQVNGPVPLTGADGVVRSTSNNRWLERNTPSAPAKEASPLFLNGRSHPSFAKEGNFCSKNPRKCPNSVLVPGRPCHDCNRHQKISLTPSWTWREVVRVLVIRP